MGAVAGVVYPDIFQVADLLKPMLQTLHRRSTFTPARYVWHNVQLGTIGHPIASNEKGNIHLLLDGSISNAEELRLQLHRKGHQFKSDQAGELLLHAYHAYGIDFLQHVNGEFAIALLDETREQLIIARDRLGCKPLYWYHDANHFIFASELNALLATGAIPQTAAVDGLAAYLSLGYVPQDLTPIENVNKLLPAYYLVLGANHHISIRPYWSYSSHFEHPLMEPPQQVATHLDSLLTTAIKKRVVAESPTGIAVNGDRSSASIAYHLSKQNPSVLALSSILSSQNNQVLETVTTIAKELGIPQRSDRVTPEMAIEDLVKVVWHLGEPIADPEVFVTLHLCRQAAAETRVLFTAAGSEELLCEDHAYSSFLRKHTMQSLFQRLQRRLLVPVLRKVHQGLALQVLRELRTSPWQARYMQATALFDEKTLAAAAPTLAGLFDPDTFLHKFHQLRKIRGAVSSFLYCDVKTRLPDKHLLQFDRLTSAYGVDLRTPYLSRDIVEYLAAYSAAEQPPPGPLYALMQGRLPDELFHNDLAVHSNSWAYHPAICEAFDLLLTGTCVETGLISEVWIRNKLQNPKKREQAFLQLWAILVLEVWLRLFVTGPVQITLPEMSLIELLKR